MTDGPPSPSSGQNAEAIQAILSTEDYVPVSPDMMADPFYRIAYLIKQEIRKYKWIEAENGNPMSWEEARKSWSDQYFTSYEAFLKETLRM